ncbi:MULTISPECIES: glutamine amidotransferase [unclassified Pseudomonas]|uniref:glutamine amidotransferase n=1 Tax=unclassified Pseudomonas TaxID=196821 RepID=UPI0017833FFB|nr:MULTISPECIES: glutamine amidotransferase [unclassified Pseudomonas]MBD8603262.1 glutamine amidotransferase [Pseudomonas sp. CFBP 8771]MBD8731996.1 glutamine amidotransferase [Pseudomonas sp. CFBP 13710]
MKRALVLRHLAFEDLGCLAAVLEAEGYAIQTIEAPLHPLASLDVSSADLLIILGGPIGAFDEGLYPFLLDELQLIRQRLDNGKPLLGICLGAQLIARALGADVAAMSHKEIGFGPVTLTAAGSTSVLAPLANGIPVLHWHGDQFDIPAQATLLAGTDACPHQAFSVGDQVLALQFHLEVAPQALEAWLVGHANELHQQRIDPRELRAQAQALGSAGVQAASTILIDWLARLR